VSREVSQGAGTSLKFICKSYISFPLFPLQWTR